MLFEVFLANLPPDITEERLRQVCKSMASVGKIDLFPISWDLPPACAAVVEFLLTEKIRLGNIIQRLNHVRSMSNQLIIASTVHPPAYRRSTHPNEQDTATRIAQVLNETEDRVQVKILRIVKFCKPSFADRLLEITLAVETSGGLLISDGSRRRTPGGTYFYLARQLTSPEMRIEAAPTRDQARFLARQRQRKRAALEQESAASAADLEQADPSPVEQADPLPVDELAEVRFRLADLRQALDESSQLVEQIKSGTAAQGGFFTAAKRVVDLQQQVDALLREYPQLQDKP